MTSGPRQGILPLKEGDIAFRTQQNPGQMEGFVPLCDLFLNKTKTEIGDDAYNKLSEEEKLNTADFQQIILESSGPAVMMIKQALALPTDTAETSWLERLDDLTGEDLVDHIEEFVPNAKGQDLAPSAALNLLASHFEDYSKKLASQWKTIHDDIVWFEVRTVLRQ